jgi:hypothetical protein
MNNTRKSRSMSLNRRPTHHRANNMNYNKIAQEVKNAHSVKNAQSVKNAHSVKNAQAVNNNTYKKFDPNNKDSFKSMNNYNKYKTFRMKSLDANAQINHLYLNLNLSNTLIDKFKAKNLFLQNKFKLMQMMDLMKDHIEIPSDNAEIILKKIVDIMSLIVRDVSKSIYKSSNEQTLCNIINYLISANPINKLYILTMTLKMLLDKDTRQINL